MISNPVLGDLGREKGLPFFQRFIPSLITLSLVIGSIIFFFTLLIGAIQWISSGGDKGALEAAKGKISNALIGLVVLFSVFAVAKLIETFFGISILTLDISSLVLQ